MTKKLKPTYLLQRVKELIVQRKLIPPKYTVLGSANEIGCSLEEAYDTVLELDGSDFVHSITEFYNHKIWQDVYKRVVNGVRVYIKFKIVTKSEEEFLLGTWK